MSEEQTRADDSKSPNKLSAKDPQDEKSSGLPRWLKIAAVVVPLLATLSGGIWKIAEWYKELQIKIETERTNQEKERTKQGADKLAMEKEVTARLQISTTQDITVQKLRTEEQQRRTEEQQSKERISKEEIAQRQQELILKKMGDEANRERLEGAEVTSNISKLSESPLIAQEGLTRLVRYAANPLYRDFIVIALSERFKKIRTFQEAQLAIKLARAIKPEDFNLIAGANRVAMQYIMENFRAAFWHSCAPHIAEMDPMTFLEVTFKRGKPFVRSAVYFDIQKRFPDVRFGFSGIPSGVNSEFWIAVRDALPGILKELRSPDMDVFEAYSLIVNESSGILVDFIEAHKDEPLQLDISDCYLSRYPEIDRSSKIKLIREGYR
jgi:hypothetical protein